MATSEYQGSWLLINKLAIFIIQIYTQTYM